MIRPLTNRQRDVATFITDFIKQNSYPPSVREVAEYFQFSVKAAHDHLKALEAKKVIRTTPGSSRSIEIIDEEFLETEEVIEIPVIGTIAAGKPLLSEENTDYMLKVPVSMLKGARATYFALKVRGESMIEEGIFDGDLAIIRKTQSANSGAIVAATVEDGEEGITLKGYYPGEDMIELRPANSAMGPIFTRSCRVHGILQLLIRDFS
ncbi:MAG: LexA repressor [Spirochaetes bacterium ADurb.Bin315]|jgi:repressor LexA|nr:transcriptional repressor LexA [Spirochaetota bacterium]OQA43683.1 MAG: LexA repressor [Spirochaetes bacterium ADurb.Bin315]HOE88453.1 transcriptional repressor LexA [Sphaerochaeta sp.]HOR79605.1 transcriptional repressor LexA [Sphaerochaeta sp.]HPB41997.1 transcriptional repressor LexA [Sphaerochaeta sp.]